MSTANISLLLALIALAVAGIALFLQHRHRAPREITSDVVLPTAPPDQQRSKHYTHVLENCDDVAWLFDIESKRLIYVTPSVERLRGWTPDELIGKTAQELVPANVAEKIDELMEELKQRQFMDNASLPSARIELDVQLKNSGSMPVETEYKVINDDKDMPTLILGISRDITQRRRLEQVLRDGEERVRLALHCSGDGIWDINLQTREMSYLDGWEDVLGYSVGEVAQTFDGYLELVHGEDRSKIQTAIDRHLSGETPNFQSEVRIRAKDGSWRWCLSRGMLWSRTADKKPLRMMGTHTDITSRKVAEVAMSRANLKLHTQIDEIRILQEKLAEQAVRDPLTGLYNRRYLDETLDREFARARREGHPLSVVMIDVDYFKRLNDSYGHQAGDEVLKSLGELLRQNSRTEDVACRYGGEEFLVLLPSMPLENARGRAEQWRIKFEQSRFVFGNFTLQATASFGVSSYPHHGKTPEDLTHAADTALYSAKHNGRNRVELYEDEPIVFVTGKSAE